jgi:hypothetical protein
MRKGGKNNEKNFCFSINVSIGNFFFQPITGKKENIPGEDES